MADHAFEGSLTPGVTERREIDRATGVVRFVKTQVVSDGFFAAIRARRENVHPTSLMRYRASVPIMVAQAWAKECGAAIGTRVWRQYASNKVDQRDYSKLRGD
jgi:hypothetical protein